MSGVPKSSLANYLSGRTLMPVDVLDRVVIALGVTPSAARSWAEAWERATAQRFQSRSRAQNHGNEESAVDDIDPAPRGGGDDRRNDPSDLGVVVPWREPVPVRGPAGATGDGTSPVALLDAAPASRVDMLACVVEPVASTTSVVRSGPAQLPAAIPGFAGRERELARLDAILGQVDRDPTAPFVCVISGTAGVGKTTLAVYWAQRAAGRFPDGQLYVSLRGFSPSGRAMCPSEALRGLLDALGEPPHRIPADLDAQAARYRSRLAGRRVLVVLDNARDAEQVRHLLPGSPGCLALVTSRSQLGGLVAVHNAYPLTLDLLTVEESRQLLALRIGADRVSAEAATVDEIIGRCSRLPLAMSVVAAGIVTRPNFPLYAVADRLRDIGSLDAFAHTEASADARSVFSWSYQTLSPPTARMFRLLGQTPGHGITTAAAASLAGIPVHATRRILAELTEAHLLSEHAPDRFIVHDLLRLYATELTRRLETDQDRYEALRRLLDHYLHTAYAADRLLYPHRHPITLDQPVVGVTADSPADTGQALGWFVRERTVLLAVLEQAAAGRFDQHTWQLAWAMTTFLQRQGHWNDWMISLHKALDAGRRLGDRVGQAHTHRALGRAYGRLRRHSHARRHLRQALDIFVALDDRTGQAVTNLSFAWTYHREARYREAFDRARRALELYEFLDHRVGQADTLNLIGWLHIRIKRPEKAIAVCEQALLVLGAVSDHDIEAANWECLGCAYRELGNISGAIACYERALEQYRAVGHRHGEAEVLTVLGDIRQAVGNRDAAHQTWRAALDILDQLRHPDADHLRDRLQDRQR